MNTGTAFLESVQKRFREYKSLGEKTFAQLTDEQLITEPAPDANSIAIIVHHLHGNMLSRWTNFLTEDGEKEWRKRDEEFEPAGLSRASVLDLWNKGWDVFLQTLDSLTPDDLLKTITIRSQPLLVIDAINRQLAHYSYHVGQIVLLGKYFAGAHWKSLSIPKEGSAQYNQELMHANKA
jgi:hypothetical protein